MGESKPIDVPECGAWLFVFVDGRAINGAPDSELTIVNSGDAQAQSLRRDAAWEGWHQGVWLAQDSYSLTFSPGAGGSGIDNRITWVLFKEKP